MIRILSAVFILLVSNLKAQTQIDSMNIYTFYFEDIKYEIIKEPLSWADAAKIVDERGGIITEINSQTEQDTIFYHLNKAEIDIAETIAADGGGASYVWIGGNDIANEGIWMWDGNYDGLGKQFWEGDKNGTAIDELYNNWGNEPDNFSNQDALGLAITNWAYGIAGEWNDVQTYNKLYSVFEYDNSTFKVKNIGYLHDTYRLVIDGEFLFSYDSIQVIIDSVVNETFYNVTPEDSLLFSSYVASKTAISSVHLKAFRDSIISLSNQFKIEVYSFNNPIMTYATDFEDIPEMDFISQNFTIEKYPGFRNYAIHSLHDYENESDYTITMVTPFIVDSSNSQITYTDVAIVEPGDSGSVFNDEEFNDYVILEGSKEEGEWLPLQQGYDASKYPDWEEAWESSTLYRNLFKRHIIEITETFAPGDTILIRFRLHSNEINSGWGWVIDSLSIQDLALGNIKTINELAEFRLDQNYPNPFNPSTTIKYEIPDQVRNDIIHVQLKVYDILGREVATLINKEQKPGYYEVTWNAANNSSGVYFYTIMTGEFIKTKKMLLLR